MLKVFTANACGKCAALKIALNDLALGFEEISRRARYYADGSDAVIMRRARPEAGS